jgi:hypothetical protein
MTTRRSSMMVALLLAPLACSKGGGGSPGMAGTGAATGAAGTGAAGTGNGAAGTQGVAGTQGTAGMQGAAGTQGTAGTQGGNGTGAAGTTGAAGAPPLDTTQSVYERNKHPSRDGHFIQAQLTKAKAGTMVLDAAFKATFTGAMWASPLYAENGPGGKGAFFAVTTTNDVLALDEATGATLWKTTIGPPPTTTGVPCGNISPLGIISTPVIDPTSRTIYVGSALAGGGTAIMRHEVHALSLDDGKERAGWPVDVTKVTAGTQKFNAPAQNQRGALALVGSILYVPYGGHNGDCGDYRGWIVAIDTKTPTNVGAWATSGVGEAIWAAGGLASDGNGVLAVTGNNLQNVAVHADSEEVVRITGMATLTRNDQNVYYPARWRAIDIADSDFGSNNAMLIRVPGATPASMVVATAKDGHMYFLDSQKLGGMDGHLVDYVIASATRAVRGAPTSYTTAAGVHVALSVDAASVCPTGGGGRVVMSILVPPGAPPKPQTLWCVPQGGPMVDRSASPISTTTDGTSEAIVWFMNGTNLNAIDGDSGAQIFKSADACSGIRQWTSPIAVKGRIVVGGDGHLCAWAPR